MAQSLAVSSRNLVLSPQSGVEHYLAQVRKIPILSAAEECALARRFRNEGDVAAARSLVLSHLRFVAHIARSYRGYGLAYADLIQEGNIGLMKAVKRFDPAIGVRLISFAVHWIRAEIHEFVLRNWRIVRVATTKAQRKLFFNLRSFKHRLGWLNREEVEAVAKDLGVSCKEVIEMESRLSGQDVAFDPQPKETVDDQAGFSPAGYLVAPTDTDPAIALERADWAHNGQRRLKQAMATLDERSRDILKRRWLSERKQTLQELAAEYRVSAERIRQIEAGAIDKLRVNMTG